MSTKIYYTDSSTPIAEIEGSGSKILQCGSKVMTNNIIVTAEGGLSATINVTTNPGATITCSKGTTSYSGIASSEGTISFNVYENGTWTITENFLGVIDTTTCEVNQIITASIVSSIQRVGGRIFYIHSDNGCTYRFYKYDGTEITDISVSGLADAYYYARTGTPTADKFYVYDNTTGLVSSKTWGKYNITTGLTTNTIGSGKTNTAAMMNMSPDGTLWTWLRDTINANSVGGCSDWFIASNAEQDQLRSSGLVNWYSSSYIWSSLESSASYACLWNCAGSFWRFDDKSYSYSGFAARAF